MCPREHLDRLSLEGLTCHLAMQVPGGAHRLGEHAGIARVRLRARRCQTVPVAGDRERVHCVHLVAPATTSSRVACAPVAAPKELRRTWPVLVFHAGGISTLFAFSGVVPLRELQSDFVAAGLTVGMTCLVLGLAGNLWHSLGKNLRRTSGEVLGVGFAWLFTAMYFLGTFSNLYWIESVRDSSAFSEPSPRAMRSTSRSARLRRPASGMFGPARTSHG